MLKYVRFYEDPLGDFIDTATDAVTTVLGG
jgi:hypothetical protein